MQNISHAAAAYFIQALSLDKQLADQCPPKPAAVASNSLIEAFASVYDPDSGKPAPPGIGVSWSIPELSVVQLRYFDSNMTELTPGANGAVTTQTNANGLASIYVGCTIPAIVQLQVQTADSTDTFPVEMVFCNFGDDGTWEAPEVPTPVGGVQIPFLYEPDWNQYEIVTKEVGSVIGTASYPMIASYIKGKPAQEGEPRQDGLLDIFQLADGATLKFGVPYVSMNPDDQQDNLLQYLHFSDGRGHLSKRGVFRATGTAVQMPKPNSANTQYKAPRYKWQDKDTLNDSDARDGLFEFLVPFWPTYNVATDVDVTVTWYPNGWIQPEGLEPNAKPRSITQKASAWGEDKDFPGYLYVTITADALADYGRSQTQQNAVMWVQYTVGNLYKSVPRFFRAIDFSGDL